MLSERFQQLPNQERPEAIYQDIETKIEIIKNLWTVASALEAPRISQSPTEISDEKAKLKSVFTKAGDLLPKEISLLNRYHHVINKLNKGAEKHGGMDGNLYPSSFTNTPEFQTLIDEQDIIQKNPEFAFLNILEEGIEETVKKRQQIRQLQAKMKSKINRFGYINNPNAYNREKDIEQEIKGHIKAVIFQPFSVCIMVEHNAFVNFVKSNDVGGMHLKGLFSYIDIKQSNNQELIESIKHEDFHSFIDSFKTSHTYLNNSKNPIPNPDEALSTLKKRADTFVKYKNMDAPKFLIDQARILINVAAQKTINQVENSNEELLSELASNENRIGVPNNTFSALNEEAVNSLEIIRGQDNEIDEILDNVSSDIKIESLVRQIKSCYRDVLKFCPEKTLDLDCAFAIIPPSKIGIVRKLVKRWVAQADKNAA